MKPPRLTSQSTAGLSVLALLPFALTAYWILEDAGLYRLLIDWELSRWGVCYEGYTGVVVFAFTTSAFALLVRCLLDHEAFSVHDGTRVRKLRREEGTALWRQGARAIKVDARLMTIATAGFFLLVVGAFEGLSSLSLGPRTQARVGSTRADQLPSRWLVLKGRALTQRAVALGEERVGEKDHFVPLGDPDGSEPGEIKFLLHVRTEDLSKAIGNSDRFEGIAKRRDLAAPVRAAFTVSGVTLADRYVILDWRETPETKRRKAAVFAFLGAALLGLTGILFRLRKRA